MKQKLGAAILSAILSLGAIVGITTPAQAAVPDGQLSLNVDNSACGDGYSDDVCESYDFIIAMKKLFEGAGEELYYSTSQSEITYALYNARGQKVADGDGGLEPALYDAPVKAKRSYAGMIWPDDGNLPHGKYTLRVKVFIPAEEEDCTWQWNRSYTTLYNSCWGDQTPLAKSETNYLTYAFNYAGKSLKANRQTFKSTAKKTETTLTTYTTKKSASYTGTAKYTSKQTAKYKRNGKTYKATATSTVKKTEKVTKSATVKTSKLKKTATATATVTSYYSQDDATNRAKETASKTAKSKATKNAKSATDKKASDQAKAKLTKKVKDAANKKAKSKITKKVKADTQQKAYKAALKAAKKKAGIK